MHKVDSTDDGLFCCGKDGVLDIVAPSDKKVNIIEFEDKTLVYVKSSMGYPAYYPLKPAKMAKPVKAVLMDLDGTSVVSEEFWMWVIEQTVASALQKARFTLECEDEPHVSGHSVSEHLSYCISKYCPDQRIDDMRNTYFRIVEAEMLAIMEGHGRMEAFKPRKGLKEFLLELKERKIRIALVTSGLYEKAYPEIWSAFRQLKLGKPEDFYDAIITAGQIVRKGQCGTLGELESKPHPWLYAEVARIGLGMPFEERSQVIGIEDSSAGVVSIRLAGFAAVGISGGNIEKSGVQALLSHYVDDFSQIIDIIDNRIE